MSSIFQEIEIDWRGETYHVTPTMKLINRIENDVSLSRLALRAQKGDVPLSHVALVFSHLLKAGGCNTSDEEVYSAMFGGEDNGVIMDVINTALTAFYPSTESGDDLKKSQ